MFKVGQEVWSTLFGKGIVRNTNEHPDYPIGVKFEEDYFTFTAEGVWGGCEGPSLFPYPVKIVPEDTPDYPFMLEGKPVKVRDLVDTPTEKYVVVAELSIDVDGNCCAYVAGVGRKFLLTSLSWPIKLPEPKKRWAYISHSYEPRLSEVSFTSPMTESEAREEYGQVWEVPEGEK